MAEEKGTRLILRFRLGKRFTEKEIIEVSIEGATLSRPATLKSEIPSQPISETDWLIISSRGYSSVSDAERCGLALKGAVLLSGARQLLGVDAGVNAITSG